MVSTQPKRCTRSQESMYNVQRKKEKKKSTPGTEQEVHDSTASLPFLHPIFNQSYSSPDPLVTRLSVQR